MSRFHYQDPQDSERDPFDTPEDGNLNEFEELLSQDQGSAKSAQLKPGTRITGPILRVSTDFIFIDLGGKNAGALLVEEYRSAKGEQIPKIGEEVSAFVKMDNGSEIILSLAVGRGDSDNQALLQAHKSKIPVEAKIEKIIKGGFEASIGRKRAFVPLSQMELGAISEPEKYIGASFQFIITEFSQGGRNIVLSRRALLSEERRKVAENILASLDVGKTVRATVMRLAPIGAFVDLGGIDALIPLSEMANKRVKRPEDVVKVGEIVEAKVIRLEREPKIRVALSLKDSDEVHLASNSDSKFAQKGESSDSHATSNPSSHNTLAEAFAKAIASKKE